LAKIHKSVNISLDKSSPVFLDIPVISQGLRELMLGDQKSENILKSMQKNSSPHSVESYYVESVMMNAGEKADEILRNAKTEAEKIENQAVKNSEIMYEHAQIEGYKSGMDKALFEIESFKNEIKKHVEKEISTLKREVNKGINEIENEIIDISFLISKKIVCYEIENNEKAIVKMVSEVLEKIKDRKGLKVFADKRDIEKIKSIAQIRENEIEIIEKGEFDNHQCVIESIMGSIDLSWSKKVERIAEVLKGESL